MQVEKTYIKQISNRLPKEISPAEFPEIREDIQRFLPSASASIPPSDPAVYSINIYLVFICIQPIKSLIYLKYQKCFGYILLIIYICTNNTC